MSLKPVMKTKRWILSSLLFYPALLFATANHSSTQLDIKPTLSQAVAAVNTVQILSRNAYDRLPLDKKTSERFFEAYIDSLDPQHTFFLASDINAFNEYRTILLSDLKSGKITPGFIIFQRYKQRYHEYLNYQIELIKEGLNKLDLSTKETLQTDRKKSPWLASAKDQHTLWHKQMVNTVITMMINGKNKDAIAEQLKKRYGNQLKRLNQTHSEDVFQLYLNALTMLYDPHTQYFSPSRMQNFNIDMSLSLEGIGAVLQFDNDYTKVASIVPGGPADKGGQLKPGDRIIGVAQGKSGKFEDIVGMRLDDVVKLIRGPKASTVRLEVMPAQEGKTRTYSITRDKVKLEEQSAKADTFTVKHDGKNYKIGLLRIPTFYLDFKAAQAGDPNYKSTTRDVRKLLKKLKNERVNGIIIDLRGNGGGSLQEAIELTGLFIPSGPTVIVRNSQGDAEPQMDTDNKEVYTGPLAVMANRLSASASEIFAGAMQDYHRAIIIGSQTYGKGTVQTLQPLNDGQLKLTIAKFYRVSGQSTQNRGVMPDIKFPALFDTNLLGESALPNALPWDTIRPTKYTPLPSLEKVIHKTDKNYQKREKTLPYFQYVHALRTLDKEYMDATSVSLNLKTRKQEFNKLQQQQLAIENKLRKTQKKPLLKSLEEMEKEQITLPYSPKKENPEDDAYLQEAGTILADAIHYKTENATHTMNANGKVLAKNTKAAKDINIKEE